MVKIVEHAAATEDLTLQFLYLLEHAGDATANRFLSAAQAAYDRIAAQPKIGAPLNLPHPALAGLRKWPITDFENHLLFYLPRAGGLSVLRVLHSARDWLALIEDDA